VTALASTIARSLSSTAVRLSLASVAAFVVTAGVVVLVLFLQANAILTDQVLATLRAEAKVLTGEAAGGIDKLTEAVKSRSLPQGPGLYFLVDANGQKFAGNLSRMPPEIADSPSGVFRYSGPVAAGDPSAERLGAALKIDLDGGAKLVVGRDIEDQRAFAERIKYLYLASFGLLALAGLAVGLIVSRLVLKRIEEMAETSRSIMSGDMQRRVALSGNGDEFDSLAGSLNAMLDRIEQLMTGLREVSDNVAHDLKSPLTRLRNRAEAALRDTRGDAGHREALERTIEEADDVIKTFNAILLVARLEAGVLEDTADRFDLGALVHDVAELYTPLAEETGMAIRVVAGAGPRILANRQLVGQAVANLIDNAMKYGSLRNGSNGAPNALAPVEISVVVTGATIEVAVGDRGPGIPAADRERVLRRFVRLEQSRTRPGTGIGLNLVAAVARLHGGKLRLEDNGPGLKAVLELPLRLKTGEAAESPAVTGPARATAAPAAAGRD